MQKGEDAKCRKLSLSGPLRFQFLLCSSGWESGGSRHAGVPPSRRQSIHYIRRRLLPVLVFDQILLSVGPVLLLEAVKVGVMADL